ncbi:hypothetical protein FGB62_3g433 [Gracilaria domingensis]|nr:hypothetical protein FGB62_3g433 [Gracilaria domingensis]
MRGLTRLFTGREWPSHLISEQQQRKCFASKPHLEVSHSCDHLPYAHQAINSTSTGVPSLPLVKHNFSKLLLPATARAVLLLIEFGAIYAGTNRLHDVNTQVGFDCRLARPSSSTPKLPLALTNSTCDNFLGPARAESNTGELLRCVSTFSISVPPHIGDGNMSVAFVFDAEGNQHVLRIERDAEFSITNLRIQVMINSLSRDVLHQAPLRPDLQFEHSVEVFKSIISDALNTLGVEFEGNLTLFREGSESGIFASSYGKIYMVYSQLLPTNVSQDVMASALTDELRALPLERNSSGAPWVHDGDNGYSRNGSAVIATIGLNRIAHGTLLIMIAVLWLLRLVMTNWFGVGFEEAGYLMSQMVLEDHFDDRCSQGSYAPKWHAAELRLTRFALGRTGHFGYTRTDEKQVVVSSFEGCDEVI